MQGANRRKHRAGYYKEIEYAHVSLFQAALQQV